MADSSLEPDNWCVVNHLPFTDVYGVALPTQRFFAVIRSFPLQRIPTERDGARPYRQDLGSGQNRPNAIAFLVAATGEEMPADLCCTRCAPVHRGGQWEGCFISAATDDCQEKFSYSCSNCVYHGEKTRCSLFSTQRPEGLEDADPLPLTEAEQFRAQVAGTLVARDLIPQFDTMCQNYLVALCDERWERDAFNGFKDSEDYSNWYRNDVEEAQLGAIYDLVKARRFP